MLCLVFFISNVAKTQIFEVYCILADLIFVHFHEILRTNPLKILVNPVSAYIFEDWPNWAILYEGKIDVKRGWNNTDNFSILQIPKKLSRKKTSRYSETFEKCKNHCTYSILQKIGWKMPETITLKFTIKVYQQQLNRSLSLMDDLFSLNTFVICINIIVLNLWRLTL
jgi:hypothetical protein